MKKNIVKTLVVSVGLMSLWGCGTPTSDSVGVRVEALDKSAWLESEWISAANAPVVEGRVWGKNERAADGSSWFVTTLKNQKKVTSARWMTTGLGVYELYVNGKLVGEEILKPGFTHYEKTKRSFTYDITKAINSAMIW